MRTIYAVSSGDYSAYYVHCLFEREADATEYATAMEAARAEVQQNFHPGSPPVESEHRVEPFQLWDAVPIVKVEVVPVTGQDRVYWQVRTLDPTTGEYAEPEGR